MRTLTALLSLAVLALAGGKLPEKAPGPKAKGKLYQWKAKDGLVYRYFVPKKYDPEKGGNLTFILHGSNSSAGWGFSNHKAGQFRPDDVVVSPDGTTPNGRGGFNFLGEPKDAKRLHALHKELKQVFKVNATFLYGHSQGSFFAFYYAGLYPDEVQGVVGHASGFWGWTKRGKQGHHQAIVFMHGTQDPVVPYGQSVDGYRAYKEAKYPILRLRSLENWNHWPAEHNGPIRHTSQQLCWVEGMTTGDAQRLKLCFEFIADCKSRERTDYAGVYTLAKRVRELPFAGGRTKRRAENAVSSIEALAAAHLRTLKPPAGASFDGKAWIMHLPLFLRSFVGVPAREEFAKDWQEVMAKHEQRALVQLDKYWTARNQGKSRDAFANAVAAIEAGFLYFRCHDNEMLKKLKGWRKDARKLKIPKKALKDYDALVPALQKAVKDGYRAFDSTNRKVAKF